MCVPDPLQEWTCRPSIGSFRAPSAKRCFTQEHWFPASSSCLQRTMDLQTINGQLEQVIPHQHSVSGWLNICLADVEIQPLSLCPLLLPGNPTSRQRFTSNTIIGSINGDINQCFLGNTLRILAVDVRAEGNVDMLMPLTPFLSALGINGD